MPDVLSFSGIDRGCLSGTALKGPATVRSEYGDCGMFWLTTKAMTREVWIMFCICTPGVAHYLMTWFSWSDEADNDGAHDTAYGIR